MLVFWVPAWHGGAAGSGSTGHNAVWLTPVWRRPDGSWGDGTRLRRLVRASIVPAPFILASALPHGSLQCGAVIFALGVVALAVGMVPFTKGGRSLSGLLTGAQMRDIREGLPPDPSPGEALDSSEPLRQVTA